MDARAKMVSANDKRIYEIHICTLGKKFHSMESPLDMVAQGCQGNGPEPNPAEIRILKKV